jgi:hypothetical protein
MIDVDRQFCEAGHSMSAANQNATWSRRPGMTALAPETDLN